MVQELYTSGIKAERGHARRRRRVAAALVLGLAISPLTAHAVVSNWTGATSTDWNDVTNWDNGFPDGAFPEGVANVNTLTPNIATITADSVFQPSDVYVGFGTGVSGRIDIRSGTLTQQQGNWAFIGNGGGNGVVNIADTTTTGTGSTGYGMGSGSWSMTGNMYIGGRYIEAVDGGSGTMNINTTGTITAGLFDVFDTNTGGAGVVNLENGTIHSNGELWVGAWGTGTSTLNQSGGTVSTSTWIAIGRGNYGGGTGTYNLTGGTINAAVDNGFITLGSFHDAASNTNAQGTLNVSGTGVANSGHQIYVGEGGTGTLNVGGGGAVNAVGALSLGVNATGIGTVNLNAGGTITAAQVSGGAGTGTFNFNGGTLKANSDTTSFFGGVTHAVVTAPAAIIDTNGHNVTASQVFEHDTTLGSTADGGLTKNGAGTLTLSGASTYTGATVINAGTLKLAGGGAPQAVGHYTFDELPTGTLAGGTVVANTGTGGTGLNGTVNHADYQGDPTIGGASIVAGHTGNALALDGYGSSVDIANKIVDQSGASSWTFSAWIGNAATGSSLLSKNDATATWNSGDSVFYLGTNPVSGTGGSLPTAVRNSSGFIQGDPTPASVTDGGWHMLTFVDDHGTKMIYVDGVATTMTISDFNLGDPSSLTRIGYNIDTLTGIDGAQNYTGTLDDLTFFDGALGAAQILSLYNTGTVTTGIGSQQYLPLATAVSMPVSGATLDLNGNNQTIGSLSGVAGTNTLLTTSTLTTGGNNTSTTYAGVITGTGGITKAGTGTFTVTGANTYTGATTVTAGVLKMSTAAYGTVLGSATVTTPGGADIQGGKLVLDYTGGSSPASQVKSILTNGYGQANKFSSGLLRSTTLAANRTLGWRENTATSQVEVAYTVAGDSDLSFAVNFADLLTLAQNYGGTSKVWAQGDFNYDTKVDFADLLSLAQNYNQVVSALEQAQLGASFSADFALAQSMVPEPATLSVLGFGAAALMGRRRRPC